MLWDLAEHLGCGGCGAGVGTERAGRHAADSS